MAAALSGMDSTFDGTGYLVRTYTGDDNYSTETWCTQDGSTPTN